MRVRISCVEVEGRSSSASIGLRPWGVNPSVHQCVSVYLFQCLNSRLNGRLICCVFQI